MHNMNPNQFRDNDIVFGNSWFKKHQSKFLFLLNNPLTKRWFRWCLRIRQCDIPLSTDIIEIAPNRFSWGTSEKKTTDFRTHDKFAKRLYFAFKPFWYLLHFIDWSLFDRYEELAKLSFGFSTLTVYPGSTAVHTPPDGYVSNGIDNTAWATLRNGTGNGFGYGTGNHIMQIYSGSSSGWVTITRSIFCFDTSSLTSGATISATVMSLYGNAKQDGLSITPNINVYTSTPANTDQLVNGDFSQLGTTAQCDTAITYAGWSTTGYNDFTFNATGLSNISKTGVSKLGARNANYDVANSEPSRTAGNLKVSSMAANFSDSSGTSNDPKLVVTYTTVVAPTVTTQAATNITKNSFTGNGNITATGGANATRRGFCYKVGTTGDPTIADSIAYDDGDFGTGAFTKSVTSLTPKTGYRVAAYATNSSGTSYGATVQVTTLEDTNASFLMLFM